MEVFGKFWSIIIGFILIFICPIYITQIRVRALTDIEVVNLTDRFLDKVKYTGYIDRKDMDNLYTSLSKITSDKELSLLHKRRAVRSSYKNLIVCCVMKNGEIVDTGEFYIEVSDAEIKNELKRSSKYRFKIGDEICCVIKDKGKLLNLFPEKTIELGGMIENEYIKN